MNAITLSPDQQAGYEAFSSFLLDPHKSVFVLAGYSGTGKSTLVRTLLEQIDNLFKMARLINPSYPTFDVKLTATTNKACEALRFITQREVVTIHSALGLRVHTDYSTNKSTLVVRQGADIIRDTVLFVDEASFVDDALLRHILKRTERCKIVFIGDPAQLLNVGCDKSPVFNKGFEGVHLSKVVRQAEGNPIIELSTKFRETVSSGEFFSFLPDGLHIQHMDREAFDQAILEEFGRQDWHYHDSKVLAWTNKCVVAYNRGIREYVQGDPDFQIGDYAVCNHFVGSKGYSIKTDQLVQITGISEPSFEFGLQGKYFTVDNAVQKFMPDSLSEKKDLIRQAEAEGNATVLYEINNNWIDLRAAFACTINKSQGSTFRKVFIDLDDIKKCTLGSQIARLMYVGVSRASEQVIFTGDLV